MPIGAIIGGVATLGGALLGSSNASKAAQAGVDGAKYAADIGNQQYNQTRADMAPWRTAGAGAIGSLSAMLQPGYDHTTSPGYQFRFGEGQRAIESSAAARGSLMSGGTLKDLARFGQGIAADDFNQSFNRTASVAAGGQQVNQTLGQLGAQNAQYGGAAAMDAANARASGYAAQSNVWGGAANNLAALAGRYF